MHPIRFQKRIYSEDEVSKVLDMKHTLMILVFATGLSWCGCSTATSKIRELWENSASTVEIPSVRFTEAQGEAAEGDAVAQFLLGEWYRTGEEVKRDTAQAYAWFTISARNGYPPAKARVRAGWNGATIARGKELAEILIDKYPSAVFIP
jgi:TPR repeat protein